MGGRNVNGGNYRLQGPQWHIRLRGRSVAVYEEDVCAAGGRQQQHKRHKQHRQEDLNDLTRHIGCEGSNGANTCESSNATTYTK